MEYSFSQFENSLTRQAEIASDEWAHELAIMNDELMNDPMAVVRALNEKKNLCTPGFLLRRQVQERFADLVEQACTVTGEFCENLLQNGNVDWPENTVGELARRLEKYCRTEKGSIIKASEWKKWMKDEQIPAKRELALKLTFLLEMDACTTSKFLLACGHESLSVRNPLDCICLFCRQLNPPGDWQKVESILQKYEAKRPEQNKDTDKTGPQLGFTEMMSESLPELAGAYNPQSKNEHPEDDLIAFMCKNDAEFTRRKILVKKTRKEESGSPEIVSEKPSKYLSGYSLQRRRDLLELTRYLVILYPEYDASEYSGGDRRGAKEEKITNMEDRIVRVQVGEGGFPNLQELSRAFLYLHDWEFEEPGMLGLQSKSAAKKVHDSIPFNKDVYLFCKEYEKKNRLKAIERIIDYPENAEAVERKDILLMAYLFISGFSQAEQVSREQLYNMATDNADSDPFTFRMEDIINMLFDVVDELDEKEVKKGYIGCINLFLSAFAFEKFYPPFIFDRFILFALYSEEIGCAENLSAQWLSEGYSDGY